MSKRGAATNDQYAQVLIALIPATATAIKDFAAGDILGSLPNQEGKLTQCLRLAFTAIATGQDLMLASDQQRTARPSVLEALSTHPVSAIDKFVAKDHFMVGTTKGVEIARVGDNFKKIFLNKVETAIAGAVLRSYKLLVRSRDHIIMTDLGDNHTSYLGYVWELMAAQPKGEEGALLTNGYENVFYVTDDGGTFWEVDLFWNIDGWDVEAYSLGRSGELDADVQVFGC